VLFNYLEAYDIIPWPDLRYMFGEVRVRWVFLFVCVRVCLCCLFVCVWGGACLCGVCFVCVLLCVCVRACVCATHQWHRKELCCVSCAVAAHHSTYRNTDKMLHIHTNTQHTLTHMNTHTHTHTHTRTHTHTYTHTLPTGVLRRSHHRRHGSPLLHHVLGSADPVDDPAQGRPGQARHMGTGVCVCMCRIVCGALWT
jgi:hypothetical protein